MTKSQTKINQALTTKGAFVTKDARLAKVAKGMPNVIHVFSTDLGDGKVTHRFIPRHS